MSRMMLPDEVGPTPLTEGEIRAWKHGRAEGERAGIEMAARHIDRRWLTNASQSETVLLKAIAGEVRTLVKIEVK